MADRQTVIEAAGKLYSSGLSAAKLAPVLGLSYRTACRYVRISGVPLRSRAEIAQIPESWYSSEWCEAQSKRSKRMWSRPEHRTKVSVALARPEVRAKMFTPERNAKVGAAARLREGPRWAALSLEERQKATQAAREALCSGRATRIEVVVGEELRRLGVEALFQKPLGAYIVDYYVPGARLVIECDGDYWHSRPAAAAHGERRDSWLLSWGYKVAHITESAIKENCVGAVATALEGVI